MHFLTILAWLFAGCSMAKSYQLGVGRADCTGPPVEIVFVSSFIVSFLLSFFHSRKAQRANQIRNTQVLRTDYNKQTKSK